MDRLVVTSCLAANTHAAGRLVTSYLSQRLGIPADFAVSIHWQERERLLDEGQIHLGWICGLLYVSKVDRRDPRLALLAAPVMRHPRYRGQPCYYSDILVRRDSPFYNIDDLKGARWVYNEPGSYSGYTIVCHHLARHGESLDFFDQVLESGAHLTSLQMVLGGQADVTAIDSTVFDDALSRRPGLAGEVRVISSLGPSPIPPWVVSLHLPLSLRRQLRELLLAMHLDPEGRDMLAQAGLARFVATSDSDYQRIRDVAQAARPLTPSA